MNPNLLKRRAIALCVVLAIFILVGLAVSPLFTPSPPPIPPNTQDRGFALFGLTLQFTGGPVTFNNSLSVASLPSNVTVMALTPVETKVTVNFDFTGTNMTSIISIRSVALEINNAVFASTAQTGNTAVLDLHVSTDTKNNWEASGSANIEYTQGGDWRGSLTINGVLNDGTGANAKVPVNIAGFTIGGPVPKTSTLSDWFESAALWGLGVLILVVGVYSINKQPDKNLNGRQGETKARARGHDQGES